MKKLSLYTVLLSLLLPALGLVGIVSASTGDLWSWMDTLSDQIPFGYTNSQKISITQVTADKIVINSPIIVDELGTQIKKYTIMFSQYPLAQILDETSLIDEAKEKTFDFTGFASTATGFTMELTTGDLISGNVVYYISVIPKDQNAILGEISNEMRFKLATLQSGEGAYVTGHASAGGADMALANITHTITNHVVTLKWTAVDGSDSVDIFLRDPTAEIFNKLSTVTMSAETYSFTLTRNGEYIVKFMPNNAGTEISYTFTAQGIVAASTAATHTTSTVITTVPTVGPTLNIFITFVLTFIIYTLYRRPEYYKRLLRYIHK